MPRAHKQAEFLSIQAQDFIEDGSPKSICMLIMSFLSIQAQDFIEETTMFSGGTVSRIFLSIQAQDFIEESSRWKTLGASTWNS